MALYINGERIEQGLIEQEFGAIKAHFESLGNISCCERDEEFRGYAQDNITARVLLAQQAEQTVPQPDDASIDAALERLYAEHGGREQFYAASGIDEQQNELLREQISTQLRTEQLVEQLLDQDGAPDNAALRAFYQEHIENYMTPEKVRVSHVLKSPKRAEDREPAYQQLREIRRRLLGGGDFEAEAAEHSDKPAEETDLGFFQRGEILEEFERVAFSMQPGEISPVFVTPFGLHLIKVTEADPATAMEFDDVKEKVAEHYTQHRREAAVRQLVERLKAEAKIEEIDDAEADEPQQAQISHGRAAK